MTQQYLVGELSWRLSLLAATGQGAARDEAGRLRRAAETCPLAGLGPVIERALMLTDAMCWDSLRRGDVSSFARQTELCADLYGFGVCADLIDER